MKININKIKMVRKPRGKTKRYSINYDFIYGKGNKPWGR